MRREGEVAYDEDGIVLSLIGDYGYVGLIGPLSSASTHQWMGYRTLQRVARDRPEAGAFRGRRVYMTPGREKVEGTGLFGRAYTLIIGLDGEILHISRFHDTAWAPIEPRATRVVVGRDKAWFEL